MKVLTSLLIMLGSLLLIHSAARAQNFWQQTNISTGATPVLALATSTNTVFAGTNGLGVYRTSDLGANWTQINSGLTNTKVKALAINASGHIFAGTDTSGVYRSTDNGDNWTQINAGLTYHQMQTLAINASGHIFAGTFGAGAYRSTDNGDNWAQINTGLTSTDVRGFAINTSGHVFAGTADSGVYQSTNNGNDWTKINAGLTYPYVRAIAINASGHIFAGTTIGGAFRSTDNGNNWTQINTGLFSKVYALAIDANGNIFAGTPGGGVFRSSDNGDHWTDISGGLWDPFVSALAINLDGYAFAGVVGKVDRSVQPTTEVEQIVGEVPSYFALDQNYPNPFNPTTTFEFQLPSHTFVSLKVFNVLGEEVATLVAQELPVGTFKVQWNASGQTSGMYFYRLNANSFSETKKLVLLK